MDTKLLSQEDLKREHSEVEWAKRDPEAFRILYDRYYPVIFRYIFNKIRDKEITADLTSQVFLAALINIKKYKFQDLPFSAWLYRLASNETGQYFRKAKRAPVVSIDLSLITEIAEDKTDFNQEYWQARLKQAVQTLSLEDIQLVDLRFQESKSFKEIGLILDITENNAKVKTYRVLDKLRVAIKKSAFHPESNLIMAFGSQILSLFS